MIADSLSLWDSVACFSTLTYTDGKRRYISSDPDIFRGFPIIKGTRIPVYAIQSRLADDDTFDDLVEDYPEIPKEAFKAADTYACTHPEKGRRSAKGRPWEKPI